MYRSNFLPSPVIVPLCYHGSETSKFKIGPNTYIKIRTGKVLKYFNSSRS